MLAKDAYCYHFGGVTRKDEIKNHKDKNGNVGAEAFYKEAREDFIDIFGIDPLSIGVEYDPILFEHLECNDSKHVDILGINCGIGSTPLKIKESIKENVHNLDVSIYNIVDEVMVKFLCNMIAGGSAYLAFLCFKVIYEKYEKLSLANSHDEEKKDNHNKPPKIEIRIVNVTRVKTQKAKKAKRN